MRLYIWEASLIASKLDGIKPALEESRPSCRPGRPGPSSKGLAVKTIKHRHSLMNLILKSIKQRGFLEVMNHQGDQKYLRLEESDPQDTHVGGHAGYP